MWIAACVIVLVGGYAFDRAFRAWRPHAHEVFSNTVLAIEVSFVAMALIGGAYHAFISGAVR
jgi:hypothetical protein